MTRIFSSKVTEPPELCVPVPEARSIWLTRAMVRSLRVNRVHLWFVGSSYLSWKSRVTCWPWPGYSSSIRPCAIDSMVAHVKSVIGISGTSGSPTGLSSSFTSTACTLRNSGTAACDAATPAAASAGTSAGVGDGAGAGAGAGEGADEGASAGAGGGAGAPASAAAVAAAAAGDGCGRVCGRVGDTAGGSGAPDAPTARWLRDSPLRATPPGATSPPTRCPSPPALDSADAGAAPCDATPGRVSSPLALGG